MDKPDGMDGRPQTLPDLIAARIKELAANGGPKGGDPNPTSWQRLEQIHGRGNGPELTRDQVFPDPVDLKAPELLPSSADDPTDELDEIEEALGINPHWQPNLQPLNSPADG